MRSSLSTNRLKPGEFGNAIRGPLGIHRGANRRYWFYGADYELEKQMAYLKQVPKVSAVQLEALIAGKAMPPELAEWKPQPEGTRMHSRNGSGRGFRILDYIKTKLRKVGRNYVTRCPSCAEGGHDRSGDNMAISIEDPRKYICWAGWRHGGPGAATHSPSLLASFLLTPGVY